MHTLSIFNLAVLTLALGLFQGGFQQIINFPSVSESCNYYREITISNTGQLQRSDLEVFFDFYVPDYATKTDCTDFVLIDDHNERKQFFLEKSCKNSNALGNNRMYFMVDNILKDERLVYLLYYGCNNADTTYHIRPPFNWIILSKNECPSNYNHNTIMDGKFLRVDSQFGNEDQVKDGHTHTVEGGISTGTSDVVYVTAVAGEPLADNNHFHSYNSFESESTVPLPLHYKTFFCSGKELDIFNGALILTEEDNIGMDQYGYDKHVDSDDHYFVGTSDIEKAGTSGGSPTHVHYVNGVTNNNTQLVFDNMNNGNDNVEVTWGDHNHRIAGNSTGGSNRPPYFEFHVWESVNDATSEFGVIRDGQMFLATGNDVLPFGYEQFNDANGYFVMSSSMTLLFGRRGGTYNHSHSVIFSTQSSVSNLKVDDSSPSEWHALGIHTHVVSSDTSFSEFSVPPHVNLTVYKRKTLLFPTYGVKVEEGEEMQNLIYVFWLIFLGSASGFFFVICICCVIVIVVTCIILFLILKIKKKSNIPKEDGTTVVMERELTENNKEQKRATIGKSLKEFFSSFAKSKSVEGEKKVEPKIIVHSSLSVINIDEIKLVKNLGEGGSGATVFQCEWNATICAFKIFRTSGIFSEKKNFDEFEKEVAIIGSIKHPNIIQHYGWVIEGPRVGILLEYCELGELMVFIMKKKTEGNAISMKERIRLCTEIAEGLRYLHAKNVIHRDVKSSNVLISKSENAKIIDFGLAKIHEANKEGKQTVRVGTSYYMAPEVLSGVYDSKCDVFSYSILLFEVFTENQRPYEGRDTGVIELKVANDPNFRPIIPEENDIPPEIITLMKQCWLHDSKERPTFENISKILGEVKESSSGEETENSEKKK